MNIEGLINQMRIRPQTFVFPVKIESIFYYIDGFLAYERSQHNNKSEHDIINSMFWSYFCKWAFQWIISNKNNMYQLESLLWFHMFRSVTHDEKEAVELFFSLCEEFFICCREKDSDYWNSLSY